MSKGSGRRKGAGYEDNYDKIFGDKRAQRGTYVQDPETGKLVSKADFQSAEAPTRRHAAIHGDIDSFVSPVDGSVISDRGQLREHNRRHGVTNVQDYGPDWFKRRGREKAEDLNSSSRANKAARVDTIKRAMHEHGIY